MIKDAEERYKMPGDKDSEEAIVKVSGKRDLVELIVENLLIEYYATTTSPYRDSDGGGVFIYVKILGERS